MTGEHPRSRVFYGPTRVTKDDEETAVTVAFLQLYAPNVYPKLAHNKPVLDPPDRLIKIAGLSIGIELTAVDQDVTLLAKEYNFTNAIYAEFEKTAFGFSLEGLCVSVLRREPELRAATGKAISQSARDVVNLVHANLRSVAELSSIYRHILVDSATHPRLHATVHSISLSRCPPEDPRRSDWRASPLVIMAGGNLMDRDVEDAKIRACEEALRKKAAGRMRHAPPTSWSMAQHAILLFHDHPRGRLYSGFGPWGDLAEPTLREAVRRLPSEAGQFDEVLFLTYRKLEYELIRISGQSPSR